MECEPNLQCQCPSTFATRSHLVYVASTNCPPLTTPSATRAPAKSIASKRIRTARLRHVDHLRDVDTANAAAAPPPVLGTTPDLCWTYAGPTPDLCWTYAGPMLDLRRTYAGPMPDPRRTHAGPMLDLRRTHAGPMPAGPMLDLCWTDAGPMLD